MQTMRMMSMVVEVPSALLGARCCAVDGEESIAARAAIAVLVDAQG